jgi:hypothetical protein
MLRHIKNKNKIKKLLFYLHSFDTNFVYNFVADTNLLVLVELAWEYSGIPGEESVWGPKTLT